jgi:hypothetical protein
MPLLRHRDSRLNLETGEYLALCQMVGRLLEALETGSTVQTPPGGSPPEYGCPTDQVERMCLQLCARLAERGLAQVFSLDA